MSEHVLTGSMATRLIINRRGAAEEERALGGGITTIGSDPSATLRLSDPRVAPEQAIILDEGGQLLLINRAEGTLLNGESLAREARRTLSPGDRLAAGPYEILLAPGGADTPLEQKGGRSGEDERAPSTAAGAAGAPDSPAEARGPEAGAPAKSFAAILDSLRTEEDSFYFLVETAGARSRVALEGTETVVGWDETGRRISCDAARVASARAVVRKDWGGVLVLPLSAGALYVNGETVEAPRRLRNGDRLTLLPTPGGAGPEESFLVFHEPASLVVLDTLLPQKMPPPVSPAADLAPASAEALAPATAAAAPARRHQGLFAPGRRYFGYSTPAEVLVMVCGTLVAAAIIFLILEFS